jgi:hypothetical protein
VIGLLWERDDRRHPVVQLGLHTGAELGEDRVGVLLHGRGGLVQLAAGTRAGTPCAISDSTDVSCSVSSDSFERSCRARPREEGIDHHGGQHRSALDGLAQRTDEILPASTRS